MTLAGKIAVVTGASRGIGRSTALALAGRGAQVALWARRKDDLLAVAKEISDRGGKAIAVVCDVSSSDAVAQAALATHQQLGPVDILVNNAGAVMRGATHEVTDAQWRAMFAANVDGAFYCYRALAVDLRRAGSRIISVASIAGREGTPMLAAYCAAKHALVGFTRALAEELRVVGVSVNAVCPGSVDTAMLREGLPEAKPAMSPDDIARTIEFLAADAPAALTGACLDVWG
ncbi:MAG: SDR family oxidoreductase [Myxococcales bacterium]|nr:SDR family oxidoreductase [Myxococcales bacterium]